MKRLFTKRFRILLTLLSVISSVAFSQFDNVDFLRSAPSDGMKFTKAYISPWANAFGAGLNSGWYNTAKPHKFGGFDITTDLNVGFVPKTDEKFDVSTIGLSSSLSGSGLASTVAGPNTSGPAMTYSSGGYNLATFNTPPGTAWKYIPTPMLQVGVGLPLGTELKARFIPKIHIKGGDVSLWGVGLMHSIMQYIPGNKLSPLDVSLFGGFTKLVSNIPLNLEPDLSVDQAYTAPFDSPTAFDNQKMNITVQGLTVSAIASLNLRVITFYGGLGYCKTKTELRFKGYYPTPVLFTPGAGEPYAQYNNNGVLQGSDFPDMTIENFSGIRANIGFRLKLSVITFHVDYTQAQYNVLSTGLGLSFR